jgi:hypothetical protein
MMEIHGRITTVHRNAPCVAAALTPDNLTGMATTAQGERVTMIITGTQIRSVIASMDDYLMNLAIAEDACSSFSQNSPQISKIQTPVRNRADAPGKMTGAEDIMEETLQVIPWQRKNRLEEE